MSERDQGMGRIRWNGETGETLGAAGRGRAPEVDVNTAVLPSGASLARDA